MIIPVPIHSRKHRLFSIIGIELLMLCLFFFVSCGEDRTYEYEEKTACDHWILSTMKENYLWGDSIKEEKLDWKNFFSKPATFFEKVTAFAPINDEFSWCAIDTLQEDYHMRGCFNHYNSYGIDYIVMSDPTGSTSRQYARVMTVYPNSPAQRCGLERGDFIGMVDGTRFSSNINDKLIKGVARKLVVSKLGVNTETDEFVWNQTDTILMESSQYVVDEAFPVYKTFDTSYGRVCYLMCNRLTEGPTENTSNRTASSTEFRDEMIEYMSKIKNEKPYALILDLRLCNYGTISMAQTLASYLVSDVSSTSVFAKTIYRKSKSELNTDYLYKSEGLSNNLGLKELIVITSSYTQGAAEWLIRGVRASMGDEFLTIYGSTTAGQIVLTDAIKSNYFVTLHPAVAYVADGESNYDYAKGIEPSDEIDERSYAFLYPYGNTSEVVLNYILQTLN